MVYDSTGVDIKVVGAYITQPEGAGVSVDEAVCVGPEAVGVIDGVTDCVAEVEGVVEDERVGVEGAVREYDELAVFEEDGVVDGVSEAAPPDESEALAVAEFDGV